MLFGKGSPETFFSDAELVSLCVEGLKKGNFSGKKVLVIIPDTTRSGPIKLIFRAICEALQPQAGKVDFIIALGTHPEMSEEKINSHLGLTVEERSGKFRNVEIFQHRWSHSEELRQIGVITAARIAEISAGLLCEDIPVTINKKVFDYQELILVGPVFPHEVVGFSGGYKYLFPGIAGPQFLHKFHWLGALITNPKINGTKDTPVRRALNEAASFLGVPITNICYVVKEKKTYGLYIGGQEAWSSAADLSGQLNIQYVEKSFHTVLSMAPKMYEDIWTAGKCMYKLEPVVADKGTLIVYAPHITEVSYTHGDDIKKVGYHTRDFFLKQWDKFKDISGAILAHSTHVKGIGIYTPLPSGERLGEGEGEPGGREEPRINVVLATGIPEEECRKINLGYLDFRKMNVADYTGKEAQGILKVENAGEVLFRLSGGAVPDIDKL